jgi:hypothetical protein
VAAGVGEALNWMVRMSDLPKVARTSIVASVVQALEGRIAEYSGASAEVIEAPVAWPKNYMLAHNCCSQKSSAAALVVGEPEEPDIVRDCMADESCSAECRLAVVDIGWVAIEIGFEQNAGDCKAPGEEEVNEGQESKAGTGVDILIMPDLRPQTYFDWASGGFEIPDCSKTAPLVACSQTVLGLEVGRFDICFRSDQRTPHHRHCQNLTAGVDLRLAADCSGLGLQEVRIVLEAHAHTVVDRFRGKTSSGWYELAHNRNKMYVNTSL